MSIKETLNKTEEILNSGALTANNIWTTTIITSAFQPQKYKCEIHGEMKLSAVYSIFDTIICPECAKAFLEGFPKFERIS